MLMFQFVPVNYLKNIFGLTVDDHSKYSQIKIYPQLRVEENSLHNVLKLKTSG